MGPVANRLAGEYTRCIASGAAVESENRTGENTMNRRQLKVMWVAIGIVGLMCLFPPWVFRVGVQSQLAGLNLSAPGPYRLIFLGPPDIPTDPQNSERFKNADRNIWNAEVDWARLLLPIMVTAIISSGLIITFRGRWPGQSAR